MRQRGNHYRTVFFIPHRAHAHGATAVLVNFADFRARGDDFRLGRVVRALNDIQHLVERGLRFFNQGNRSFCHFAQVVRRNVRRHTDGDTGGAVQQDVRQARRQHFRLLHGAVKVRHPISRALPQLA